MKYPFRVLILLALIASCQAAPAAPQDPPALPPPAETFPKPGDADFPTPSPSPRHDEKVAAVRSGRYDLVLIGDSITHTLGELGGKYEPLRAVWESHFVPRHAINLGHNGYRTEQILWSLQDGELDFAESPKVAVLLIGTNNSDDRHFKKVHTAEEIFAGTKAIVEFIKQRHPKTKILVLRIFPRGGDAEKGVSPPDFNSSVQCIETCRRAGELTARLADGKQVFWLDLNYVFLRADGAINTDLMWDLLHPSPAGAEAWVQAMEPTLSQLMGDQPLAVDVPSNSALVPVPKLEQDSYDWYARHEEVLRIKDRIDPEVVLIGDSITHFWSGEPKAAQANGPSSWQATFSPYRTLNLGFGWDRIQNVLWRLDHGELDGLHPRVIVLHIGTNNTSETDHARKNTPSEIAEGIRAILRRIRAKAPEARIVLMKVFPREQSPDHPRRLHINSINQLLGEFTQLPGITVLDIGSQLTQSDRTISPEIMRDFCHPTEQGYQIWGKALAPLLAAASASSIVSPPVRPSAETITLWPDLAPIGDGTFEKTDAKITLFRPEHPNGTAAVICPGGGYGGLVTGPEGSGIARWLNAHGITGIVLEYRLPQGRPFVPLLDAQRAIRLARAHSKEGGCHPNRIGIIGFSAGGHLAATAATHFDYGQEAAADAVERASCRPDFALLVYPVISMGERTHAGTRQNLLGASPSSELIELFSNEKQVTENTPPTFLAHALDDRIVSPENSRLFYEALQAHQVRSQYIELSSGDHGLNGYQGPMWDAWQSGALKWLALLGMIQEPTQAKNPPAAGRDYYVGGPNASDLNPGTASQPFATIQKAARMAEEGDLIKIRSGIYRETIIPANSGRPGYPITFQPDNNAAVTVSGADLVEGDWTSFQGPVYRKTIILPVSGYLDRITNNTSLLANQVFVGGKMMIEARWPNVTNCDDLMNRADFRPVSPGAWTSAAGTTLQDPLIPDISGGWTGGTIWFIGWFVPQTSTISVSSPGQIQFPATAEDKFHDSYYLTGKLGALDAEKEWFYDGTQLYLWAPGGGIPTDVEVKRRNYAFDLSGKSNITIKNLNLFAATITTDTNSANIVVDGIKARYISHFVTLKGIYSHSQETGIRLMGPGNIIRNSLVEYSAGMGIVLGSHEAVADNNLVHDISYGGTYCCGIWPAPGPARQTITRNTIYRTGRSGIDGVYSNKEIAYNDIFDFGLINADLGAIYAANGADLTGTRVHHNWLHDAKNDANHAFPVGAGIYFDQNAKPSQVDHNVFWNNHKNDIRLEQGSPPFHRIYHNTLASTNASFWYSFHTYPAGNPTNNQNNIYCSQIKPNNPISNEMTCNTDPQFVNTGRGGLKYRLEADSPAIDHGLTIGGVTEENAGSSPDLGAYEFGGREWTAGCSFFNTER